MDSAGAIGTLIGVDALQVRPFKVGPFKTCESRTGFFVAITGVTKRTKIAKTTQHHEANDGIVGLGEVVDAARGCSGEVTLWRASAS